MLRASRARHRTSINFKHESAVLVMQSRGPGDKDSLGATNWGQGMAGLQIQVYHSSIAPSAAQILVSTVVTSAWCLPQGWVAVSLSPSPMQSAVSS